MAKFLVVDDDVPSVQGLARLLRLDGHEAAAFTAGADAVVALSGESFDAVVTDLEMPQVDGLQVMSAARTHQPHACLVVATARAHDRYEQIVDAGACFVVDKPIDYDEVVRLVTGCVHQDPAGQGPCAARSRPEGQRITSLRKR